MTVHRFRRPDLSDELAIALERLDEAESGRRFMAELLSNVRKIRATVRDVGPHVIAMLDQEMTELENECEVAEAEIASWNEILEDLRNRGAHPQAPRR